MKEPKARFLDGEVIRSTFGPLSVHFCGSPRPLAGWDRVRVIHLQGRDLGVVIRLSEGDGGDESEEGDRRAEALQGRDSFRLVHGYLSGEWIWDRRIPIRPPPCRFWSLRAMGGNPTVERE